MIEMSYIEKQKAFYRNAYKSGIYTLEKLIEIYQDYESHASEWKKSSPWDYQKFIAGQSALSRVIDEIRTGAIYES